MMNSELNISVDSPDLIFEVIFSGDNETGEDGDTDAVLETISGFYRPISTVFRRI